MSLTIEQNVPLATRTTIGLGGPSRYLVECRSVDDHREALQFARSEQLPVLVIGGGSNLVVADAGFAGLSIVIAGRGVEFGEERDGLVLVRSAAGEPWDSLVRACVERGLAGIECLSGIPGSVGGTPIQNVGAYGQETAEVLRSVQLMDTQILEEVELLNAACDFGYRTSRFKGADRGRFIVTGVTFALRADGRPRIRYPELSRALGASTEVLTEGAAGSVGPGALTAVRMAVLSLRRNKSMVFDPADPHSHSCGSFFTNPVVSPSRRRALSEQWPDLPAYEQPNGDFKLSAAFLVERSGFPRGFRAAPHGDSGRPGVGVSERHSLALVNYDGSSHELIRLAQLIQEGVFVATGVRLEPEPLILDFEGRVQGL